MYKISCNSMLQFTIIISASAIMRAAAGCVRIHVIVLCVWVHVIVLCVWVHVIVVAGTRRRGWSVTRGLVGVVT